MHRTCLVIRCRNMQSYLKDSSKRFWVDICTMLYCPKQSRVPSVPFTHKILLQPSNDEKNPYVILSYFLFLGQVISIVTFCKGQNRPPKHNSYMYLYKQHIYTCCALNRALFTSLTMPFLRMWNEASKFQRRKATCICFLYWNFYLLSSCHDQ